MIVQMFGVKLGELVTKQFTAPPFKANAKLFDVVDLKNTMSSIFSSVPKWKILSLLLGVPVNLIYMIAVKPPESWKECAPPLRNCFWDARNETEPRAPDGPVLFKRAEAC